MIGREFYQLIRLFGGISLEYEDIIESDFAAVNGAAYSPPETGDKRRINVARTIQLLSQCPGVVETFQTSAATLRLPANTVADNTNDAGNGRLFIFKNSGTGSITIQDYLGTTLYTVTSPYPIFIVGNSNNTWDFFYDASNLFYDNTASGLTSTNAKGAIDEVNTKIKKVKSGIVAAGTFAGNPKKATITFTTAYSDANYAINITGIDARSWTYESQVAASFVINTNANKSLTGNVSWECVYQGEN